MELDWRLARRLSGREFASGQVLAREFGVSRSAIWSAVRSLEQKGLSVQAVRGRGYRLPAAVEWLTESAVRAAIPADRRDDVAGLELLFETGSTNQRLMSAPPPPRDRRWYVWLNIRLKAAAGADVAG